jgi:hypothetical protein
MNNTNTYANCGAPITDGWFYCNRCAAGPRMTRNLISSTFSTWPHRA